jgi:hypothetical protein
LVASSSWGFVEMAFEDVACVSQGVEGGLRHDGLEQRGEELSQQAPEARTG